MPIYNAETYLPQCIDSILAQDYRNFELILVNDGSTDTSGEICEHYAGQDSRIRVITQANGGVSKARNAGLDVAVGKYVSFIDADDWVDPDYLSILLGNMAEGNSTHSVKQNDIILSVCGLCINGERKDNAFHGILSPAEAQMSIFSTNGTAIGYSHCKIFDRERILSQALRFDPFLSIGEDRLFVVQYISHETGSVYCDRRRPYHYRKGHMSVTYSAMKKQRHFDKRNLSAIEAFLRCSDYLFPSNSVREAYEVGYIQTEEQVLRMMVANDYQNPELYRRLRWDVVKGWWRCLRSPYSAFRNKLAVCLSVISPKLSLLAWRLFHKAT